MVDRQQAAVDALEALVEEQRELHKELEGQRAGLHEEMLRQETDRVVAMLQDMSTNGSMLGEMLQRVRGVILKGGDSESAQQLIVEELVASSQEEVVRRVAEAFEPVRVEAEGNLHTRRLELVRELETLEAKVVALRGGSLCDAAKELGFEFGLGRGARAKLEPPAAPAGARKEAAVVHHTTPRPPGAAFVATGGSSSSSSLHDAHSGHAALRRPPCEEQAPPSPSRLPADSLLLSFSGSGRGWPLAAGAPTEQGAWEPRS